MRIPTFNSCTKWYNNLGFKATATITNNYGLNNYILKCINRTFYIKCMTAYILTAMYLSVSYFNFYTIFLELEKEPLNFFTRRTMIGLK